jgi:cytochrome oxidase Cu insertion factor (SCO1/SenC/PrrC family)
MKTITTILFLMFFLGAAGLQPDSSMARAQGVHKSHQKKAAKYTCLIHPEVVSSSPGKCSKCGMTLRAEPTQSNPATSLRIPDVTVYDQEGRQLKFYTDLVKGKTVAINFIFTTCTTICPPLTATFRRVQQEFERQGNEVSLISISVDPTTDTPERLKDFAAKFKAGPGWTFVSGDQAAIQVLLTALGTAVANKNDHTPTVLVGNDKTAHWTRTYGLSPPARLVQVITDAAAEVQPSKKTADL